MKGSSLLASIAIVVSGLLLSGCGTHMDSTGSNSTSATSKPRLYTSMPQTRPATGKNVFVFSPNRLMWGAYDGEGNLINQGIASGGAGWCDDIKRPCRTPRGKFKVTRKGGADCKSRKFPVGKGGAPMPYCTFFSGGYAIHGSYDVPNYNASHGCVRVKPSDAAWLSQNFLNIGTRVVVTDY